MQLSEYLQHIPDIIALSQPGSDPEIGGPVVENSRQVQPGGVFVARRGASADGHRFIGKAVEAGAVAIFGETPPAEVASSIPYVQVGNAARALAILAAVYEGFPARRLTVIGVTGTDGKTTTSNLIFNVLEVAGIRSGMISTIKAVLGGREADTGLHVTTPTAPEVQGYLREMVENGLTHVILESTSHGLAQHRVGAVDYDVAVVTNIQHEHLDFHGSWENYRDAKGMLFDALRQGERKAGVPKLAVVNLDDASSAGYLLTKPADRHLRYGIEQGDYRATELEFGADSTRFSVLGPDGLRLPIESALIGRFNVSNMLAAIAATHGLGISPAHIKAGIESLRAVSGRMERLDEGQGFLAVVDFAHTPNALRQALMAARLMIPAEGRVIAVWGSAGLRDPEKRTLMGEISGELADISVITAEDPRTEALDAIIERSAQAAISRGAVEGESLFRAPDRGEALYLACQMARPGDIVIACGKGHEQSMCFGEIEYPWDDREALRAALRGKPLKTLPTARA